MNAHRCFPCIVERCVNFNDCPYTEDEDEIFGGIDPRVLLDPPAAVRSRPCDACGTKLYPHEGPFICCGSKNEFWVKRMENRNRASFYKEITRLDGDVKGISSRKELARTL